MRHPNTDVQVRAERGTYLCMHLCAKQEWSRRRTSYVHRARVPTAGIARRRGTRAPSFSSQCRPVRGICPGGNSRQHAMVLLRVLLRVLLLLQRLMQQGINFMELGNYPLALEAFEAACKLEPSFAEVCCCCCCCCCGASHNHTTISTMHNFLASFLATAQQACSLAKHVLLNTPTSIHIRRFLPGPCCHRW